MIENIAVDNLIYLCQGVLKMKEFGLWNNEQGSNWLDGGAPFYCIYRSKDGAFFTVACIEQKFFKNFVTIMKEHKMEDKDQQYLLANMLNQDEWPDMKTVIQTYFKKYKAKELERMFDGKDCCVQRVLSQKEALESEFVKEIVFIGNKAKSLETSIWRQLVKEADLRSDVMITRPAKL